MSLTLILGPMKSGKSLELLSKVSPLEYTDKKVLYVTSTLNERDSEIRSRAGVSAKAIKLKELADIKEAFDVLAVDEIHMFPESDISVIREWLKSKKDIYLSGLDLSYTGKIFPIITKLHELKPENVILKVAVCDVCKKYTARFTQITHVNGKEIFSGIPEVISEDSDYLYQARCFNCFKQA